MDKLISKLNDYYQNANKDTFREIIAFMNTKEMRDIYSEFISMINNGKEVSQEELKLLEIILRIANLIYSESGQSSGMSDSEYDILVEFFRDKTNNNGFFTEKLINSDDAVSHKYKSLRGTLDKIYKLTDEDEVNNKSQKTVDDWIKSTEKRIEDRYGKKINILDSDVIVMPKFDGLSVVIEFDSNNIPVRALLRGDTERDETHDVINKLKCIINPPLPAGYEYGLKTEIMMTEENFNKFNETFNTNYKNSRSVVSAILNSDTVNEEVVKEYITIVPLRISFFMDGKETEQEIPEVFFNYPYLKCKLNELDRIHDFSVTHKYADGLRCDGSVIVIINSDLQRYLGRENDKNKFEVAFKFTEEIGYTKVVDVVFQTSPFGILSPVLKFKPIKLKGNMIENASLGSFKRFEDLGLAKGDVVKISYDIIPYANFDISDPNCVKSGNPPIQPPMICPECGTRYARTGTKQDGSNYRCPNSNCPCKQRGKILNFCKKMDIEMISEATVDDLYRAGLLNCIQDLYTLEEYKDEMLKLQGYKEKKVDNIINAIKAKDTTTLSELFGALGVEGFSKTKFQQVFAIFKISDIEYILEVQKPAAFEICKGIGKKTSVELYNKIPDALKIYHDIKYYFAFSKEPVVGKRAVNVAFSNVRNKELEQFIIDNLGNVSNSVSSKTSCLIVPNFSVTSTKIERAKKRGVPIILESEAMEYLEQIL